MSSFRVSCREKNHYKLHTCQILVSDIYFLNFRKDIKNIYAISNIVFNTSNKPESFGRSILEPLSIGVPSIGYNRGGVKEILEELGYFADQIDELREKGVV